MAAYLFFCFNSKRLKNCIFQKVISCFCVLHWDPHETNFGSLVTKLSHTLLIVNSPIYYCILSYRLPNPHGRTVLDP